MRNAVSHLLFGFLPVMTLCACVSTANLAEPPSAVEALSSDVDFDHPAFDDPRPDGFSGASETVPDAIAERARQIAESTDMLVGAADQRVVYVGTDLLRRKSVSGQEISSIYRVLHYRYIDDAALTTDVDLETGEIVAQTAEAGGAVRLGEAEMDLVRTLVLENREVQAAIEEATRAPGVSEEDVTVEGLLVRTNDADDPLYGRRVVRALVRIGRDYLHEPALMVDLTEREVFAAPARGETQ